MKISTKKQKELANDQYGNKSRNPVSTQDLKEKEKRQLDADSQVSQSLGVINKNIRDAGGNIVLFEQDDGSAMDSPNQYITTKVTTPIYDAEQIDEVVDNVVDELLPIPKKEKPEETLEERIRRFFIEYEELRDPIWELKDIRNQESHKYLVKQSKTYLPIPKTGLRYDGDVVGTQGEGKLKSGNIIELREAVFLPSMVGYQIDLYGLTKKDNPTLTIDDIVKSIITRMGTLADQLGEVDIRTFSNTLKRSLNAKYETSQVRFKQMDELEAKISEVLKELYPDLEQGTAVDNNPSKELSGPKKTVSEKAKDKKRKNRKSMGSRRKKFRRYMNPRNKIRTRIGKVRNSNRKKGFRN